MRVRTLNSRNQQIFSAWRWSYILKNCWPVNQSLAAGDHVKGGELARKIIFKQRVIVCRLQHVFKCRRGRNLSGVFLNIWSDGHRCWRRRLPMSDRDQFTDHSDIVTQPIAWIARRSIQTIDSADPPRSSACNISDPQLNPIALCIQKRNACPVWRKANV